jgi:hypothetical protein
VAQHTELVAQDGDLDVLGVLATEASEQHADESPRHEVDEDKAIGRLSPTRVLAAHRTHQVSEPYGLPSQQPARQPQHVPIEPEQRCWDQPDRTR